MWNGWPLSRVILLFTSLALLVIFVQVTLFHYRQNFRHWAMWGPVIGAPVIGLLKAAAKLLPPRQSEFYYNWRINRKPAGSLLHRRVLPYILSAFRQVLANVQQPLITAFLCGPLRFNQLGKYAIIEKTIAI